MLPFAPSVLQHAVGSIHQNLVNLNLHHLVEEHCRQNSKHTSRYGRATQVQFITVQVQWYYKVWSKTTVNAAAKCDPTERQGSSIREKVCRTLVSVCDKFQLVQCSQSVVSYGWENVCFEVCRKSWIMKNALTWNFVSNCKKVLKKHMKC